jgi:hypothetical protein
MDNDSILPFSDSSESRHVRLSIINIRNQNL